STSSGIASRSSSSSTANRSAAAAGSPAPASSSTNCDVNSSNSALRPCHHRFVSSTFPCWTTSLLGRAVRRSEEHTSELQSRVDLVCRLLLEKKKQHETNVTSEWNHHTYTNMSP